MIGSRAKGINLNTLTSMYNDVLVIYNGGVFVGHSGVVNVSQETDALGYSKPEIIEFTIKTHNSLKLNPKGSTSDVAVGVLRKLLKQARNYEDNESVELISGALTLLEL